MMYFRSLLSEDSIYSEKTTLNSESMAEEWNKSSMILTGEIQKKLPGHLKRYFNQYRKKMNLHRTLKQLYHIRSRYQ